MRPQVFTWRSRSAKDLLMSCHVHEGVVGRRTRTVTLENDVLSATVLVDKGADIYSLIYKPAGIDLLWKSPWGMREPGTGWAPAPTSEVAWLEHFAGGWQELFPNGGDACSYMGVELPFHGEASMLAWNLDVCSNTPDEARVCLSVRLTRSPFRLERTMIVRKDSASLALEERVTNEGNETLAAMWSHHPCLGAPFLSPSCLLDTDARSVRADMSYDTPGGRLRPGGAWSWPMAEARDGGAVDLRLMPASGDTFAYLGDFEEGWCAITNPDLGFGLAFSWPAATFPHAWLWQELHSSRGFPFYGAAYTMALEPASSVPGLGLVHVMEQTGTHLTLAPGEHLDFHLRATLYAAPCAGGVEHVSRDGTVRLRA
jgi:galactose mutarotase-like enzyme